ncbi:MAG: T9SS type A sorting domain-containing protein [Sphingobacteriales bacterium]|nr:MAG: T9SS type A sorting domain-containing protein [Sphingobacteriales bacterium]
MDISFTAASPAPDEYLVIATINTLLTSNPSDSFAYNIGDNVGDGIVVYRGNNTSFTAVGLNPVTSYTFFVFSSNIYCNGVIRYRTADPLIGSQLTTSGPPCVLPAFQPSALSFSNVTTNSISGSFSGSGAAEYLVVQSTSSVLGSSPADGTVYNPGDLLGAGTVVYRGGATGFTSGNLNHSTAYYYFIFALNNFACSGGPAYLTAAPLSGQQSTAILLNCTIPNGDASDLVLNPGPSVIHGFFSPYDNEIDGYLVIMSTNATLSAMPADGNVYPTGTLIGGGTVISEGANFSFSVQNLATATSYYFFVISYNNNCIGGPLYRTNFLLSGTTTTTPVTAHNFYFGNLHAHSSYSDGNKDNGALTPADDYLHAKDALCMDFLGISEHNHYTANNNPGMLLTEYNAGLNQAAAFTSGNPGFLALYGMEWGTLTNGGHALVYGIDSLIGWETINGSPNYNIFVPKNDFTSDSGLFSKVNLFQSDNAFATLAHPSMNDFNNLAFGAFNLIADSAISGVAIESGPAFSTSNSYDEPASSMSFLPYYQQMLAKGYHVAPMIDHDNHNTTFGRTAYTRTAVLSPSLSRQDFLASMKSRRFYATQDCDTKAELLIYGQAMGTIMNHSYAPAITVTADDPTSQGLVPVIRLMSGVPGSGVGPSQIAMVTDRLLNYTDFALTNNSSGYYYADISIGASRTITAPIWYTRTDDTALSVSWKYFTAHGVSGRSELSWGTAAAKDVSSFSIERSIDGKDFREIGAVTATGNAISDYNFTDWHPGNYINYYRIKETDFSGTGSYSNIVAVNFAKNNEPNMVLLGNPVDESLEFEWLSPVSGDVRFTIFSMEGKSLLVRNKKVIQGTQKNSIALDQLPPGTYIIEAVQGRTKIVKKFTRI